MVDRITYTGTNYPQIKEFAADKVMAPYFCMGFSMLSVLTPGGIVNVHEGDTITKDCQGNLGVIPSSRHDNNV